MQQPSQGLFHIQHCAGVFVDACIRDEAGRLLLLSVYGRDTAIKELLARIELGAGHKDGLPEITLIDSGNDTKHTVTVANVKDLEKLSGRLPKSVYGNLNHVWLFHPLIKEPVKGADTAWIIEDQDVDEEQIKARLWSAVTSLANIPLLDAWREAVLMAIGPNMIQSMVSPGEGRSSEFSKPLGPFKVFKIALDQEVLAKTITKLIRSNAIKLDSIESLEVALT